MVTSRDRPEPNAALAGVAYFGVPAAALLHLMHPLVAESLFRTGAVHDPARIWRTAYRSVLLSNPDTRAETAKAINLVHRQAVPSAMTKDRELRKQWVESLKWVEQVSAVCSWRAKVAWGHRELTADETVADYAEHGVGAVLLGLPLAMREPTVAAAEEWVLKQLESMEVTEVVRALSRAVLAPGGGLRPFTPVIRRAAARILPPDIATELGLGRLLPTLGRYDTIAEWFSAVHQGDTHPFVHALVATMEDGAVNLAGRLGGVEHSSKSSPRTAEAGPDVGRTFDR